MNSTTQPALQLFDSHCHLDFSVFDIDRGFVLEQCWQQGIADLCIPATEAKHWLRILDLTANNLSPVRLHSAFGLHPYFIESHQVSHLEELEQLLSRHSDNTLKRRKPERRISAVGEIGLDYALKNTDKEKQHLYFTEQLKLARHLKLPVILHARKSHNEILKQLRRFKLERGGIVHAFSGSEQQAYQYIELDFMLGFGGGITYERASKTRHLAATLPLESIVLETDAPDMPLSGFQGQRNTPFKLLDIVQILDSIRPETKEMLIQATTLNALKILDPNPGES